MQVHLLNLISTPVPVLNSLGLELSVGLSSEDPVVGRRPSEPYRAYLSVYSPEGKWLNRCDLSEIPPNRRRLFPLSALTRELVPAGDHLVVVHRVPARLVAQAGALDEPLELRLRIEGMTTQWGRPLVFKEFADGAISAMHC